MIPIAIKLFMGGLLKRLTAAFAWATASTAHLLIVALCVSILGNAWLFRGRQAARVSAAKWEIAYNKALQASDANHAAQVAQVRAIEAKSQQIAKDSQHEYETQLADANAAARAYIDSHRLRPGQSHISAPGPASQGNNPGVPAEVPADAIMVGIVESDVQACTASWEYAVGAHNNAVAKIAAGLAQ